MIVTTPSSGGAAHSEKGSPMQQEQKWCYYNHAIMPTSAPHERVDVSIIKNKNFWKSVGGYPLFARWTTDFDCREHTDWWYIIKDKPFDFMDITSKYRQPIRKGIKNFEVRIIDPTAYAEELYQVQIESCFGYPARYRPKVDHDQFITSLNDRRTGVTFAAFRKDDNSLAGYEYVVVHEEYVVASVLKAKPSQEKMQVNAALIYGMLDHFIEELAKGVYVMAGERNVIHPTNHQEYLEKTFGFRKAYCRLHIRYRRGIKPLVSCLYSIRGILKHWGGANLFLQINSMLKMEEIVRSQDV
jgi:hypothetical protein